MRRLPFEAVKGPSAGHVTTGFSELGLVDT